MCRSRAHVASLGIGKGLVEAYLQRPNTTVIGSVRDRNNPGYAALKESPAAAGSRLILVSIDSSNLEDPAKAIKAVEAEGIDHIDVAIANAGISPPPGPFASTPVADVTESLTVNAVSPFALFQAAKPLLDQSSRPVWLSMSSAAGSIGNLAEYQAHFLFGYGVSKAALNWTTMAISASNDHIIAYAVHPG